MKNAGPAQAGKKSITGDLVAVLPRLPKYAKLAWLLLKDPSLPRKQRAALMGAIGYSVSPIDAIPGFIPVIGQLDDLAVVLFTIRWVLISMSPDRAAEHLSQSGLTVETLEADFQLARRSGVRILKRIARLAGFAVVVAWGLGKLVGPGLLRRLGNRR